MDFRVDDELFVEEPEALIDQFAKVFNGSGTESPSKRTRPSPSGNESVNEDDEFTEVDNGTRGIPLRGTTSEETCASMDSGASPASLTEEDYHLMDREADAAHKRGELGESDDWYGERSYSEVVRPRQEGRLAAFTNPWKGGNQSGRATAGGGASAGVEQSGGGAPAIQSNGRAKALQSGGGAPAVVLPKAPVKTGAKVRITSKRPIVRDLGAGFVVQPAIAPPNHDPVWLEVSREKAAVQFLNLRSKTSEITTSWSTELELGKKTDLGETPSILSSVSVLLHSNLEVGFVVLDFEVDVMTPESL